MSYSPGSSGSLAGSSDVRLSNTQTNDFLSYNGSGSVWQNKPLIGAVALANGGGRETVWANYSATGAITIDLANGNAFRLTLVGNVTLTFTGAVNASVCAFTLYIKKNGGSETLTLPTNVWWPGGVAPTLSITAGSYDVLVFESITGGNEWFGALVGADFKQAA